ncbi:hypothetical protein JW930_05565 [Candidatus Woesearchaeota archaeon]|nr:hypothetical protein [Candidatus Woesearchaeota archaeon]
MVKLSKLIFSRKGVSPLIATVLLIAFSVALGAVVMNWGRSFVQEKTEDVDEKAGTQLKCTVDILLDFVEISSEKQVCYNSTAKRVEFIIENIGTISADGISLQIIDAQDHIYTFQNTSTLGAGNASKYSFNNNAMDASLSYIGISPMILAPGSAIPQVCSSNKLAISEVNECD